jgi:hypothetical protein
MDTDKIRREIIPAMTNLSQGDLMDLFVDVKADQLLIKTKLLELEINRLLSDIVSVSKA